MTNLFNFDLVPEYVDRYAGISNYDKFSKMNTRANVDMVINKFAPFSKAKRAANPTGVVLSVDGTNIDNTDHAQGITLSVKERNSAKGRNIVINNKALS